MSMTTTRATVRTDAVRHSLAPYSQAVIVDKMVYTSGCVGIDVKTGKLVPGGIGPETEQALKNVGAILDAAGSCYDNVIKVTIMLADIAEWPTVNDIYTKFFTDVEHYPARATFQAGALPVGARIEVEAVGIIGKVFNNPMIHTHVL